MNLNQVTLPSIDVARSLEFFRRLGALPIVVDLPEYARFECPVGNATFSVHRVERTPGGPGVVVYFECDDLDATVSSLEQAGVAFDSAPRDQPWRWREAHLRDPDGNVICLYHAGVDRRFPPWRVRTGATATEPVITVEDDPSPVDVQVLRAGLHEHALPVTGVPGFDPIGVFARDRQGAVVGGVVGTVNWNWLHVTLAWVAEPARRSGLGRRLLGTLEDEARRRGCRHVHLDTFSYQARPFYEHLGYEVFATLEDYPPGHRRFFLRKCLAPQ
jgi:GNAT superfamily N-acetyltransferase/predicted enzyme related to lactoylglutathione lyase